MTSTKKAELSIQVIVIAVIALLVLVLMIFIFGGRIDGINDGLGDCIAKGGVCQSGTRCTNGYTKLGVGDCPNSNEICCINPRDMGEQASSNN